MIWGGPHCVSAPDLSLQHADGVCFSEGDECIVDFVEKLESGGSEWQKTPNMAFRINGETQTNEVLPPFTDLDGLPYNDYTLDDDYLLDGDFRPMSEKLVRKYTQANNSFGKRVFVMTTMRGCPFVCSFCSNCRYVAMFGRNVMRFQGVDRYMDELEFALDKYPFYDLVAFADDDFLARPKKELEHFAERYGKNVNLPFRITLSSRTFRRDKLEILLDCGLNLVEMGVQSGSQRVLDEVYNRDIPVASTREAINQMVPYRKSHGLMLLVDIMLDNPFETQDDIIETYRYLLDTPPWVMIVPFGLNFFPGTPIYDRAVKAGFIEAVDEKGMIQGYRRKMRFQHNYATFLILLYWVCLNLHIPRYVPKFFFSGLASRPARMAAAVVPKPCYKLMVNLLWNNALNVLKILGWVRRVVLRKKPA